MSLVTRVVADALAEGYGMAKDEDVERVSARSAPPAPAGPRSTAAPARVEESETPSAEDAAKIAASTVFEPDAPEVPSAEASPDPMAAEAADATEVADADEAAVAAEAADSTGVTDAAAPAGTESTSGEPA